MTPPQRTALGQQIHKPLLKRKDLDLIVNTMPSHLHVPVTLQFLRAGFHVVCEKPLAHKAREVDKLIAAAKKARRKLAVFQQNRFNPGFQQMLKVIRSGVLGRIVQVNEDATYTPLTTFFKPGKEKIKIVR